MSEDNPTLDYPWEYKKSVIHFKLPEYLLLIGGPSNCSDRVRKAIGSQGLNPIGEDLFELMDKIQIMVKYVFQTKNTLSVVIQTSGNGGNETILYNLLDPGDKIVVAVGGMFAELVIDMGGRQHLDVLVLKKEPGETFTLEELENAVVQHQAKLLWVVHGESSGGIRQRLEGVGAMCHKHNCLLGVDAIASICVHPLLVDRWEIDAVSGGTQKAVGAPAGMCLITFSPRAEQAMRQKKEKPPYYLDMMKSGTVWNCFGGPRGYHYSYSSNMLAAVHEALAQICEEGLDVMWARHKKNTAILWETLETLGLELVVKKPENRFLAVTCVYNPKNKDGKEFLRYIKEKYDIDISGGVGATANKAFRIGLMGVNSKPEVIEYLAEALEDALKQ